MSRRRLSLIDDRELPNLMRSLQQAIAEFDDEEIIQATAYYLYPNIEEAEITGEDLIEFLAVFNKLKQLYYASQGVYLLPATARLVYEDLRMEFIRHLDRVGMPTVELNILNQITGNVINILNSRDYQHANLENLIDQVPYKGKSLILYGKVLLFVSVSLMVSSFFLIPTIGIFTSMLGVTLAALLMLSACYLIDFGKPTGLAKHLGDFLSIADKRPAIASAFSPSHIRP